MPQGYIAYKEIDRIRTLLDLLDQAIKNNDKSTALFRLGGIIENINQLEVVLKEWKELVKS